MEIRNKKITVIGAVRSGLGAAKLIQRLGGIPFVSDMGTREKLHESIEILKANKIDFETGIHSDKVYDCDLIIVSPGVPLDSSVIVNARKKNIKLISEIELAFLYCKGKIVATTGTNGKTTTTSLIAHIFNTCGVKTYPAGNIGNAFSEIAAEVKPNEFVSLEVSSYQIDLIEKFKPNTALLLNITPDHLNRYENSFDNYIKSKMNLFRNMSEKDSVILNYDDEVIMNHLPALKCKVYYFSLSKEVINGCYFDGTNIIYSNNGKKEFVFVISDLMIKGEHNIANSMAAIIAAKVHGLKNEEIANGLRTFKGVEHRLELVRELEGVKYINDSKATNVESVWYALRSFNEPLFLILGGQETGNDYNKIKGLVQKKVVKIYAIGSSADKIFNFFHRFVKVEIRHSLEGVVNTVSKEARRGEVVLLSPACKSFDMFTSYEHRGEVFKKAVMSL